VDVTGLTSVVDLAAGFGSTCAVRGDGSVWCWGENADKVGPSGWSPDLALPAAVPGITGAVSASIDNNRLCVVRTDASVRCVGWQYLYGLVGDGALFEDATVPVSPAGLTTADQVAAGPNHACAVTVGTVRCWGYDHDNQLGDGGPGAQAVLGPVLGMP
jgi:alpha-tubulin suppressor-like RCC1 family protein